MSIVIGRAAVVAMTTPRILNVISVIYYVTVQLVPIIVTDTVARQTDATVQRISTVLLYGLCQLDLTVTRENEKQRSASYLLTRPTFQRETTRTRVVRLGGSQLDLPQTFQS